MVSEEIRKKIHHMSPMLQKAHDYAYAVKEIKDEFLEFAEELKKTLITESGKIMNQIREFYSISERLIN